MGKLIVSLLMVLFSVCAYPAFYKCKDANGHWVFSDKAGACNKVKAAGGDGLEAPPALPSPPAIEKPARSTQPVGGGGKEAGHPDDESGEIKKKAVQEEPTPPPVAYGASTRKDSARGIKEKAGYVLLAIAAIISLYYGVVMLIQAFRASVWWGLGYLFVPLVALVFTVVHWEAVKRPFLRSLLALPFLFAGVALLPFSYAGSEPAAPVEVQEDSPVPETGSSFKCEGKTHCSQMTSCEEAKFYLANCPNVEMDGDNDGIPCEKQWCN